MKHPFKFTFMIPLIKTQLTFEKLFIPPDRATVLILSGSGLMSVLNIKLSETCFKG